MAVLLLKRLGLVGAAIAWTSRLGIEMVFLFACSRQLANLPLSALVSEKVGAAALYLLGFGAAGLLILSLGHQALFHAGLCAAMLAGGFASVWWYFLTRQERSMILRAVRGRSL